MKKLKNTKGITLIALIITIIVLLILAIVSIRIILNGGIIRRANDGTQAYSVAEEKEQIQLGYKEYQMAQFTDTNPVLKVEGANVEGTGPWTITFAKSGRVYELETDGTIPGETASGETAEQETGTVESLAKAGKIQIGDKINYDPGTGTIASENLPAGASIEATINANNEKDWIVRKVNQVTGEVLISPDKIRSRELRLRGIDGYNNSIEAINSVASIYKNPTYATSARSITLEDVSSVRTGETLQYSWNHRFGMDDNQNIIDAGEGNAPRRTYTRPADMLPYEAYVNIAYKNCWLASRCISLIGSECSFNVRDVDDRGRMAYRTFFYVQYSGSYDTYGHGGSRWVCPFVTLKSDACLWRTPAYEYTEMVTVPASSSDSDSESESNSESASGSQSYVEVPRTVQVPVGPWQFK